MQKSGLNQHFSASFGHLDRYILTVMNWKSTAPLGGNQEIQTACLTILTIVLTAVGNGKFVFPSLALRVHDL